jgi:hypothetical protein
MPVQRKSRLRRKFFVQWSYCIGRALEQVFEAWFVDLLRLEIQFVPLPIGEPQICPRARQTDDGGVKWLFWVPIQPSAHTDGSFCSVLSVVL